MSGVRILIVAVVALGLFLGAILLGFLPPEEPQTGGAPGQQESPRPVVPDPLALKYPTWPAPAAVLILSGEQHGYIEPCGCTENQSGGMSRRADLVQKLLDKNWPVAGLDVGGLVKRDRLQSQLKFETMLAALRDLNYKAIGLGPEDIRLRPDYLLSQHAPEQPDSIAFLGANVVFYESPELGTPARWRTFEHGGLKFGVTAVLGDSRRPELRQVQDVQITDAKSVLPEILQALTTEKVDLRVLLSHGSLPEARELAKAFPAFDIILSAGGPEDPDGRPEVVGNSVILNVGRKGKHAGVLAIYPDSDPRFRFELVQLDRERFGDSPRMIEHMRYYQQRLREQEIVLAEPPVGHPSGATFVGAKACAECHEEEFEIWAATGHGSAFDSLDPANKRHGFERLKGIPREFDPECLCCHVTGWHPQDVYRYRSGFINEEFAADEQQKAMSHLLRGSGCENCHGPGSRHIELINDGKDELAVQQVRVTPEQAQSSNGCYMCHDLDNSPKFEFETYWPKIAH